MGGPGDGGSGRGGSWVPSPGCNSLPLQAFAQNVLSKADVIQATGDAICIFRELQCLTPRGRYDIRIYPTFLHLHGKTFDYKIPYTTVLRLFLLPHKDQRQMFFVVRRGRGVFPPSLPQGRVESDGFWGFQVHTFSSLFRSAWIPR